MIKVDQSDEAMPGQAPGRRLEGAWERLLTAALVSIKVVARPIATPGSACTEAISLYRYAGYRRSTRSTTSRTQHHRFEKQLPSTP